MSTLDTYPYRQRMPRYLNRYGLVDEASGEDGFDPQAHGPLKAPGQKLLERITRHAETRKNKAGKKLYPGVTETGVLTAEVRAMFYTEFPQHPTFFEAFKRIANQDDRLDGQEQYTQGGQRWQGVTAVFGKTDYLKPGLVIPKLVIGDCSSGYTRWILWALEQSLGRVPRDVVNGCNWNAGYTGTITVTCNKVAVPQTADAIVFFSGSKSVHVAGVLDVAARTCISHGRDQAEIVDWDHHSGRGGFWRPAYGNA